MAPHIPIPSHDTASGSVSLHITTPSCHGITRPVGRRPRCQAQVSRPPWRKIAPRPIHPQPPMTLSPHGHLTLPQPPHTPTPPYKLKLVYPASTPAKGRVCKRTSTLSLPSKHMTDVEPGGLQKAKEELASESMPTHYLYPR